MGRDSYCILFCFGFTRMETCKISVSVPKDINSISYASWILHEREPCAMVKLLTIRTGLFGLAVVMEKGDVSLEL
jgi:hypothetical protein